MYSTISKKWEDLRGSEKEDPLPGIDRESYKLTIDYYLPSLKIIEHPVCSYNFGH